MIKGQTLIRAFLWASVGVALSGAYAKADNFNFSFTGSLGTVTGEIIGLTNNTTGPAPEVLIFTYPAALDPFDTNLNVTTWAVQVSNQFSESGGVITGIDMLAFDGAGCSETSNGGFVNCVDGFVLYGGDLAPLVCGGASSGTGSDATSDCNISVPFNGSLAAFNITPAAVPEPNALVLLSTVLLAVALVARKRIAHRR